MTPHFQNFTKPGPGSMVKYMKYALWTFFILYVFSPDIRRSPRLYCCPSMITDLLIYQTTFHFISPIGFIFPAVWVVGALEPACALKLQCVSGPHPRTQPSAHPGTTDGKSPWFFHLKTRVMFLQSLLSKVNMK